MTKSRNKKDIMGFIKTLELPYNSFDDLVLDKKLEDFGLRFNKVLENDFVRYRIGFNAHIQEELEEAIFDAMCTDKPLVLDYHIPAYYLNGAKQFLEDKKIKYEYYLESPEFCIDDNLLHFIIDSNYREIKDFETYLNSFNFHEQDL